MTLDRLADRTDLLHGFDAVRRDLEVRRELDGADAFTARALEMLTSPRAREAFDVNREPAALREKYGGIAGVGAVPPGPAARRGGRARGHAVRRLGQRRPGEFLEQPQQLGHPRRQLPSHSQAGAAAWTGRCTPSSPTCRPRPRQGRGRGRLRRDGPFAARRHSPTQAATPPHRPRPLGHGLRLDRGRRIANRPGRRRDRPLRRKAKGSGATPRRTCSPRCIRCWASIRPRPSPTTPAGRNTSSTTASRLRSCCSQRIRGSLMLTIFGPRDSGRMCDGVSRRDFLRVGALGLGGLTLADLLRLKAQGAVRPESAAQVRHHGLPARRPQPHRHVRSQTERPGGVPRRVQADPHQRARHGRLRVDAAAREDRRQVRHPPRPQDAGQPRPDRAADRHPGRRLRADRPRPPAGLRLRGQQAPRRRRPHPALRQRLRPPAAVGLRRPRGAGLPRRRLPALRRPGAGHEGSDAGPGGDAATAWKIANRWFTPSTPCGATSTTPGKRWPAWTATRPAPWR